jgi:NAD(P)-dependent dehydrogenase (short-subunit alcohol dehydrogenase family)
MTAAFKTVLITGSTDGIGKATALALLQGGCHVIIHGRNKPRVEAAVAELRQTADGNRIDSVSFDLGSMASVRSGAASIASKYPRLDVLINNAGIFANERIVTADKMETTFAVNSAAPYLLTHLLLPQLSRSDDATVINVSSIAHTRGTIALDDLTLANDFTGYKAYAQSKLANVMHAIDLAAAHPNLRAYSLHPGVIGTKLLKEGFGGVRGSSVQSGATTSTALALGQLSASSGSYFSDGVATPCGAAARDAGVRARLDAAICQLVGI